MIDYFIHFINKHFHLLRVNGTSTVKHRPDFMDKFRNLFSIHPCLPGNPLERTFVIRHFLYIHLNFPPQLFCQVSKLLANQVNMVFLLKIKSTYQFSKFERFIGRLTDNGNGSLFSLCGKYHKEQDGNHRQIQSPTKRLVRKQIAER